MIKRNCAIALLLAAAGIPVWAAGVSTAKIIAVQLIVTDVDPSDGVAPYFSFIGATGPISVAQGWVDATWQRDENRVSAGPFGPAKAVSLSNGFSSTDASFAPYFDRTTLQASGSVSAANGTPSMYSGQAFWDAAPFFSGNVGFILGPGTKVQLRALTEVQAKTTIGGVVNEQGFVSLEWAGAKAYVGITAPLPGGGSNTFSQETSLYASAIGRDLDPVTHLFKHFDPVTLAQSGWLEVAFQNWQSTNLSGSLQLGVAVWGGSNISVSAVPEAASLSYLTAGLLLLTLALRRGKKHQSWEHAVEPALIP